VFPGAAISYKAGGLTKQKCIVSEFWRPEFKIKMLTGFFCLWIRRNSWFHVSLQGLVTADNSLALLGLGLCISKSQPTFSHNFSVSMSMHPFSYKDITSHWVEILHYIKDDLLWEHLFYGKYRDPNSK
jgi:hypothetical protein